MEQKSLAQTRHQKNVNIIIEKSDEQRFQIPTKGPNLLRRYHSRNIQFRLCSTRIVTPDTVWGCMSYRGAGRLDFIGGIMSTIQFI
ncbi:hypothetical protein NPIL_248531, partial [Nephila pilipes]